jgi:bifunctional non-homologous end joining protein LigD
MFKAFEFCLPTGATAVPDGPDWVHEVKYDGYRLRLERDGRHVRLITRGGYVEAARKVRRDRFVLDGEAVILGVDGVSDFNALHSGKHNEIEALGEGEEPEAPRLRGVKNALS